MYDTLVVSECHVWCDMHFFNLKGEYGLREAVQEIKKKKEEIAARDK